MPNVARRHHTVPRFYLEGFARDGRIGTVKLPGDKRFVQSTADATTNNNFYALDTVDVEDSDLFERALSDLEGRAAPVVRAVTEHDVWPLDADARHALAELAAVQYLRGPNQRRQMEQIMAAMTKLKLSLGGRASVFGYARERLGRDITDEEADQIWADVTSEDGPPIQLSARGHIKQLLRVLPKVFPYFIGRPWVLIRFERRKLCTCDTPLALIPHGKNPLEIGTGLITAWGYTFPLSRDIGLLMADPSPIIGHVKLAVVAEGQFDSRQQPTTQFANLFQ